MDLHSEESLSEIKRVVDMDIEPVDLGWGREPARLLSIDAAILSLKRNAAAISEADRHTLCSSLHEARRCVVDGREDQLEYILNTLETHLNVSKPWSEDAKSIWLTAMNALLPDPYRAVRATMHAALRVEPGHSRAGLIEALRQRIRARLDEGILLMDELTPAPIG